MPEELIMAAAAGTLLGVFAFAVLVRWFSWRLHCYAQELLKTAMPQSDAPQRDEHEPPAGFSPHADANQLIDAQDQLARDVADLAAQMDLLVKDVETRLDGRVTELNALMAQARAQMEQIRQQSASLMDDLQTARTELLAHEAAGQPIWEFPDDRPQHAAAPALPVATPQAAPADKSAGGTLEGTWPIPAHVAPVEDKPGREPIPQGVFQGDRHREVIKLLDESRRPIDIARQLGLDVGEIELIANLNGRKTVGR